MTRRRSTAARATQEASTGSRHAPAASDPSKLTTTAAPPGRCRHRQPNTAWQSPDPGSTSWRCGSRSSRASWTAGMRTCRCGSGPTTSPRSTSSPPRRPASSPAWSSRSTAAAASLAGGAGVLALHPRPCACPHRCRLAQVLGGIGAHVVADGVLVPDRLAEQVLPSHLGWDLRRARPRSSSSCLAGRVSRPRTNAPARRRGWIRLKRPAMRPGNSSRAVCQRAEPLEAARWQGLECVRLRRGGRRRPHTRPARSWPGPGRDPCARRPRGCR
jgi:hypothetical protein